MTSQENLAQRAVGLTRTIWASLPWGYRLATVFTMVANAAMADSWGRQLGALFLMSGVEGMPDPGPRWNPKRPNPASLPAGYLKREAIMAFQVALKKTGNPQDAEDVVQDALVKVMTGGTKIKAVPLKSALTFFVTSVGWAAEDMAKRRRKLKLDEPKEDEEGEAEDAATALVDQTFARNPYWYDDPKGYRQVEELFSPAVWESKVKPALARVHPAMPEFFDRLLESPNPNQGVQEALRGLPGYPEGETRNGYVNWLNWLKKKVGPLLRELAEDMAEGQGRTAASRPFTFEVNTRMWTEDGTIPVKIIAEVEPTERGGRDAPDTGGITSVEVLDKSGHPLTLSKEDEEWAFDEAARVYHRQYRSASAGDRQMFEALGRQMHLARRAQRLASYDPFALPFDTSPKGIDAWLAGVRMEVGSPPDPSKKDQALKGLSYAAYLMKSKPAAQAKIRQEYGRLQELA